MTVALLNTRLKTKLFLACLTLLYVSVHVHEVKQCIHFGLTLLPETVSYSGQQAVCRGLKFHISRSGQICDTHFSPNIPLNIPRFLCVYHPTTTELHTLSSFICLFKLLLSNCLNSFTSNVLYTANFILSAPKV